MAPETRLTRRYSQHVCLSRSVLTHGPRQAHVWLIFNVRQRMERFLFVFGYESPNDARSMPSRRTPFGFVRTTKKKLWRRGANLLRHLSRGYTVMTERSLRLLGAPEISLIGLRRGRSKSFRAWRWILSMKSEAVRKRPNQALQPTPMLVTPRADARVAPSTGVADL